MNSRNRIRQLFMTRAFAATFMAFLLALSSLDATFSERVLVNAGSGFCVPVVSNPGQLYETVKYSSPGPTGNTIYYRSNGQIELALKALSGSVNSYTVINYIGGNSYTFTGLGQAASTTTYFASDGYQSYSNVINYKAAAFDELYNGISGFHTSTGRQLLTTYQVQGTSQVSHIRFQFVGAISLSRERITNNVLIQLGPAGANRSIVLRRAKIDEVGQSTVYRQFQIEPNNTVSLQIDAASTSNPIVIEQEILFAPYSHDPTAVDAGNNDVLMVSLGLDTRGDANGGSGRDVIITLLNEEMDEVLATAILASSGDEEPYSLLVTGDSPDNREFLIAGAANDDDFPVDADIDGADGFVVKIDNGLSEVLGGAYLGGSDNDAVRDIALSADGTILAVGMSDGNFPATAPVGFEFTTQMPAVDEADKTQTYFVAELNENLGIDHALPFDAARSEGHLRIADCDGRYTAGVRANNKSGAIDIYHMSGFGANFMDGYVNGAGSKWGYYALRWKSNNNFSILYSPANATNVPAVTVVTAHAAELNRLEGDRNVFSSEPPGGWSAFTATSAGELAVGASAAMHRWSTPVFAELGAFGSDHPVAMKVISWDVTSSVFQTVHEICDWLGFDDPSFSIDDVDFSCADVGYNSDFVLDGLDVAEWIPQYLNNVNWSGATFERMFASASVEYVVDPPEDEEFMLPYMHEFASRLNHNIWAAHDVESTTYVDGEVADTEVQEFNVRLVDFPGEPTESGLRTHAMDFQSESPTLFELLPAQPNPVRTNFVASYHLQESMNIRLELVDALGMTIAVLAEGRQKAGSYSLNHDVGQLSAGAYFLRLSAKGASLAEPFTIVR